MRLIELFILLMAIYVIYADADIKLIVFFCTVYLAAVIKGKRK